MPAMWEMPCISSACFVEHHLPVPNPTPRETGEKQLGSAFWSHNTLI